MPSDGYTYGVVSIYKRSDNSIMILLQGEGADTPLTSNCYNGVSWTGWRTYITNNDLRLKLYIVPKPFENNSIFTSLESWGVYIYKSGKVVMLRLNIYGNMLANNENNVLFTLPTEYISIVDIVVNYVTQKGTTMLLGISKTGEFYLNNIGKTVNDDWICRQQVTYVTDN